MCAQRRLICTVCETAEYAVFEHSGPRSAPGLVLFVSCGPQCVAWDRGTHGNSMGSRVGSAQRTRDSKSVPRGILPRAAAFLRVRRGGVCSRCSTRTEALQGVESARPLHCARDGSRRLDSQAKQQATGALVVPAVLACTHQILQEHVVHGAERVAPTPSRLVCVRARTA